MLERMKSGHWSFHILCSCNGSEREKTSNLDDQRILAFDSFFKPLTRMADLERVSRRALLYPAEWYSFSLYSENKPVSALHSKRVRRRSLEALYQQPREDQTRPFGPNWNRFIDTIHCLTSLTWSSRNRCCPNWIWRVLTRFSPHGSLWATRRNQHPPV